MKMSLKLVRAKLKNFAGFIDFVCEFGEKVTHFIGINGSGKSTVGFKGLIACLNGISENRGGLLGKRFLFIGKTGKSSDIEYTFKDTSNNGEFTIKRHITPSAQELKFQSAGNEEINDSWLKGFLNLALMSAKSFCALNGREQAIALGIDIIPFEKNIVELKKEFTLINRDIKNMGEIVAVEKIPSVSMQELEANKEKIRGELNDIYKSNRAHNKALQETYEADQRLEDDRVRQFNEQQNERATLLANINQSLAELKGFGYTGKEVDAWIALIPKPEKKQEIRAIERPDFIEPELPNNKSLLEVEEEIKQANEQNKKAEAYLDYLSRFAKKAAKEKELADNKAKQTEEEAAMVTYIKSFNFPFKGLAINEEGELVLDGRPLNESYYSRGELEIIVAQLHASLNPDFKCRFIDDFDLIDDDNQEKILNALLEKDFQVITAEVRKTKERENVIVLKECAIATEDEGKKDLL
jgi:hypothetical protein